MAIKIGVLGSQRKVKRIYVSVDGKARRVTKAYTSRTAGLAGARKVYSDTQKIQTVITGSWGNKNPILYAAIHNTKTGAMSLRGNFANENEYCALTVNAGGTATINHSINSIHLGVQAKYPMYSMQSKYRTSEAVMVFAAATYASVVGIHRRYIVSGDGYKHDESDVSFKSWPTNNSTAISASIGDIGWSAARAPWRDDYSPWVKFNFMAKGVNDTMVALAGYAQGAANYSASKVISGYTIRPESSLVYYPHDSVYSRRTLATKTSDGALYLVTTRGSGSGGPGVQYVEVTGEHKIGAPSYSGGAFLGKALNAQTTDLQGDTRGCAYFATVSYNAGSNRSAMLLLDYTTNTNYPSAPTYDVVTYVDTVSGNDATHNWYLLGVEYPDSNHYAYVLSTLGGKIKILKFATSNGQIKKVSEYDTGLSIGNGVTLQEPVPIVYNTVEDEEFEPAFVLTINNEYNKIVVVPKSII